MKPDLPTASGFHEVVRDGARLPGIIVFIAADIASFLLFFAVFMVDRMENVELFTRSTRMLDANLGLLNTLILITSGWLVALATNSARVGDPGKARRQLILAICVGLGFAIVKAVEYGAKIGNGILPSTNSFFTYYYVLTGLHFLHFIVGIALLITIAIKSRRPGCGYMVWLESGGLYWHMVDILWVFLFPLLYLQI